MPEVIDTWSNTANAGNDAAANTALWRSFSSAYLPIKIHLELRANANGTHKKKLFDVRVIFASVIANHVSSPRVSSKIEVCYVHSLSPLFYVLDEIIDALLWIKPFLIVIFGST